MRTRIGEPVRPWFRSERYYHTGDGWWTMTREDQELGPFDSQVEAENELSLYVRKTNLTGNMPSNPNL